MKKVLENCLNLNTNTNVLDEILESDDEDEVNSTTLEERILKIDEDLSDTDEEDVNLEDIKLEISIAMDRLRKVQRMLKNVKLNSK